MLSARQKASVWIVGAALTAGCMGPEVHVKAAAPPQLGGGWTAATNAADGVSLGVPPGWREGGDSPMSEIGLGDLAPGNFGGPDGEAAQAMASQMKNEANEEEEADKAERRSRGILLQLVDSSRPIPGEARTRIYVKLKEWRRNPSLKVAAEEEAKHVKAMGTKPQPVNLPIGPAMKLDSHVKNLGGDEVDEVSYVVVDGNRSFALRLISTNNPGAIRPLADQVAQTWRVNPKKGK